MYSVLGAPFVATALLCHGDISPCERLDFSMVHYEKPFQGYSATSSIQLVSSAFISTSYYTTFNSTRNGIFQLL